MLRPSVVCNICIVAKTVRLAEKLLLTHDSLYEYEVV